MGSKWELLMMVVLPINLINLLLLLTIPLNLDASSPAEKSMDPGLQEEFCRNFTVGNTENHIFFSPSYPLNYPAGIKCFRTISADYGYFVRIDFRDFFRIEPASNEGNCDYDYLEIRDGDQGYSTEIGKFCGSDFPPIITSSGRSLWLRFVSDGTIEYSGFKAVYQFIPNPLETLPFIPKCEFEVGGSTGFIGTFNISEEHTRHAEKYQQPIDCTWIIRSEENKKIYVKFDEYELNEPNDCNFNFIQIFDGKTDIEHRQKEFCGSIAEPWTSESDVLYLRYFADGRGIGSTFEAVFTTLRKIGADEEFQECPEGEYDCDDATCINSNLVCNGVKNCKFGWDEDGTECMVAGSAIPLDFSETHVIIILILLILIMVGMCTGMIYNLIRKLSEDKEDILASRERRLEELFSKEKSLMSMASIHSIEGLPSPAKSRMSRVTENLESCNGCYVPPPPGGGFPFGSRF